MQFYDGLQNPRLLTLIFLLFMERTLCLVEITQPVADAGSPIRFLAFSVTYLCSGSLAVCG
jgi:hypothetical protein